MRKLQTICVTGGAGFIGSNFIRYVFEKTNFQGKIVNLDKLTYAGNPHNLTDIAQKYANRYAFVHADICDRELVRKMFTDHNVDTVIHFAAESHVDRSIHGPGDFIRTNIDGTFNMLENARAYWQGRDDVLFHHVSTDEVYGSLGAEGYFYENTSYDPRSPYSASKASSDHIVRAYYHTYNMPVTVSNCSNNYGPYHFPEKLIPLMILNIMNEKPLPVYGKGQNVRDWLYVEDHARALWLILQKGSTGETYNVGGENEWQNITLVRKLCGVMANRLGRSEESVLNLITYVNDRAGHDLRYAINCDKIKSQLGWAPTVDFEQGLALTVDWYLSHPDWIKQVQSGEYQEWIKKNYR